MIKKLKDKLLKYRIVENYFRFQRGWPIRSNGPKGDRTIILNPYWDDMILSAWGTISECVGKDISYWIYNDKNPSFKYPFARCSDSNLSQYDTVFLPVPWDEHPEHIAVSKTVLPDKIEAWGYQVYGTIATTTIVDISDYTSKFIMLKKAQAYLHDRDWIHYAMCKDGLASRHLHNGMGRGYAELFCVMRGREWNELVDKIL